METWWQNKYNENENFEQRFLKWESSNLDFKEQMYKFIIDKNCKSVLNCGCGSGLDYNLETVKKLEWKGFDITEFMVNMGKRENRPVEINDIKNMTYPDNFVDATLASHVFEHLKGFKIAMNEMIRVSRKYVFINFFKPPRYEDETFIINVHKNNRDTKIKVDLKDKEFVVENPGFRNGFSKNCVYCWYNRQKINSFLSENQKVDSFEWIDTSDWGKKNCLLVIKLV